MGSQDHEQRPAEVIAQLESLLSATAEELEQQRRLNQALIKRKVLSETMKMIAIYNSSLNLSRTSRKIKLSEN